MGAPSIWVAKTISEVARQQSLIAWAAKVNHRLYRAYLLKEQLRQVFALKGEDGKRLLHHWLAWARRCRIPAFVHLAPADRQAPHLDQRQP